MTKLKQLVKKIVIALLWLETRLILLKYQPKIVGITGSVGKTSTKDAIAAGLAQVHQVRASAKSYNSDIGIPLTVIGQLSAWGFWWGWLKVLTEGLFLVVFKNPYPAWLVIEVGADRPRDIVKVVRRIKFDAAAISHLPELPVHVEFFGSAEEVRAEKLALPRSLAESGLVVLNADDQYQMDARLKLKAHVITYGLAAGEIRGENIRLTYDDGVPTGITFKLNYDGHVVPVKLNGVVGTHQIYPALAAAAVSLKFGVNLFQVAEALGGMVFPPGRLRLVPGINQSLILDDSYNSSPVALTAALNTLAELKVTGRKIAVIGDMLELGEHTIEAHKAAGRQAAGIVDTLITVGVRSKFVAEGAKGKKLRANKIHHFDTALLAGEWLDKYLKKGDTVLVKGSQSIRLEKTVAEIMAEPDKKALLLCRQERQWQER
ncbi:MAG: hypothetical protein COV09_01115 [Candidatus Vogelbacteria bacterium CG10_big_fil_rev_8_21_14_0_10_50_13]|uniref:UDP-N-acetylmuramoyl-tripeptide--D-alanyl-D-alanine ligase n=1 Tax=Candidatus Vogelbacteria bacterium CG10_big_fil_rev_8_21_14_0_10_50_13 TaxID=1975044 RepID=A0A2H0RG91_9BACT|nr:MAG: hypothetical protein COV09_01115 [Candidatus Vogelbacteria bacterium CG10_big_fil_rev_8_21_14_0_10_50_13]